MTVYTELEVVIVVFLWLEYSHLFALREWIQLHYFIKDGTNCFTVRRVFPLSPHKLKLVVVYPFHSFELRLCPVPVGFYVLCMVESTNSTEWLTIIMVSCNSRDRRHPIV